MISDSILALLQLDWPRRAWTHQELAVASEAVYGYSRRWLSQDDFHESIAWCSMAAWYHPSFDEDYRAFQNREPWAVGTRSILQTDDDAVSKARWTEAGTMSFLSYLQSLHASDPRDKIFSVHEILRSTNLYVDAPNYELQPSELFTRLTTSVMESCDSLRHLEYFLRPSSAKSAPSWVIDWSDTHAAGYYVKTARATGDSRPCFSISAQLGVLSVKGTVVGHTRHCYDTSGILWRDTVDLKRDVLAHIPLPKRAFFASLLRLMECVTIIRQMNATSKHEFEIDGIVMDTVDLLIRDLIPPDKWSSLSNEAKRPFSGRLHVMMSAIDGFSCGKQKVDEANDL